jgi:uncharacterized protein YqeY
MIDKIKKDLQEAQKAKEELKVSTLRLLLGAIKNFEIAKQGTSYVASDEEIASVVKKEVRQRKEAIEQFKAGGRNDLVEKETKELEILQKYLPEQLSEEEIQKLVDEKIKETGARSPADIGKVMGVLSGELKGKADMSLVSSIVKRSLGS